MTRPAASRDALRYRGRRSGGSLTGNLRVLLARSVSFWRDQAYASYWQLRHLAGGWDASSLQSGHLAPVLVLPGVYETWQFLRPAAEMLHRAGHPVHVVPDLGYNLVSIPATAARAHALLVERDLREVIIVAHSKGGVVGKHMMVVEEADEARGADAPQGRISRLIAVNSPFAGSRHARYISRGPLRDFAPTEETILKLAANAAANSRITSIYSTFDPHIPEGSRLAGARNIEVPVGGHFRLLGMRQVLDLIESAARN